jgi:hypothetical protein
VRTATSAKQVPIGASNEKFKVKKMGQKGGTFAHYQFRAILGNNISC